MNKIKAAIIEDEVPAARLLHEMIQSLRPDWEVMILPGTIEESVEWFHVNPHPELLFLDIQLTDGNSFMLIEQERPDSLLVFANDSALGADFHFGAVFEPQCQERKNAHGTGLPGRGAQGDPGGRKPPD